METFVKLKSCCCGCNLKTGTKITVLIGLIVSIAFLLVSIFGLIATGRNPSHTYWLDLIFDKPTHYQTRKEYSRIWQRTLIVWIVYSSLNVIIHFLLFLGVYKERKILVRAYLFINVLIMIASLILGCMAHFIRLYTFKMFTLIFFEMYSFFVVKSYYYTMKNNETNPNEVNHI